MIEYKKLSEICSEYNPAYKDSWEEWFNSEEIEERTLISRLVEELKEKGEFEEPVVLSEGEYDEENYYYPPTVLNGMHRMAAHHKAGIELVKISLDPLDQTSKEYIEVYVENGDFDLLLDILIDEMSWRVNFPKGSTWLRLESISQVGPETQLLFYGYDSILADLNTYRKVIEERLLKISPETPVKSISKVNWED